MVVPLCIASVQCGVKLEDVGEVERPQVTST